MYLRIKEDTIMITCNKQMKQDQIKTFILKHQSNILNRLENQQIKIPLYNSDTMSIFGVEYNIVSQYSCPKNTYSIKDNQIFIHFKTNEFDTKYVEKIYQQLLLKIMEGLLVDLTFEIGNSINLDNIMFKTQLMKSRYGSCIPKKRIVKLNSILARFDEHYTKVILIHELVHLKVSNHQKEFYKYIDMWIPNYRQIIKEVHRLSRKYVI